MMNPFGISQQSYSRILNTLQQFPEVEEAAIFGSRAKGNYRNGSDIDLVLFGDNITYTTTLKISTKLNQLLPIPYYFDVLDYKSLNDKDLINHIDRIGQKFYKSTLQTH